MYGKFPHLNVGGITIFFNIYCCTVARFINRTRFIIGPYATLVYKKIDRGTEKKLSGQRRVKTF